MKKARTFGKKNQKGATLVMVIGIFSVLIIIVTATVSVAVAARRQTYTKYCNSQAYYYANSALNVFVSNTATDASLKEFLTNVSSAKESEEIKIGNNSTVKYYITKQSDGKLLVKVEGTFDGRKAYSSVLFNSDGTVNTPIFNAASVSLDNLHFTQSFFATGDIISKFPDSGNGKCEITNYTKIHGNIYSTGNIEFNSNGAIVEGTNSEVFSIQTPKKFSVENSTVSIIYPDTVKKAYINCYTFSIPVSATLGNQNKYLDIHCTQVSINNPAKIYGNLYLYKAKDSSGRVIGSPSINLGNSTIYGDVYIDGNVSIASNNATIKGNLIVTGSCSLSSIKVEGNVYCSSYSAGWNTNVQGEVHSPSGGDTWDESHDRQLLASKEKPPIDDPESIFKKYEISSEDYIAENNVNFSQNSYNASQNGLVINKTGTLNGTTVSGKTITINVKDQVIWLQLNVKQFDQCKIVINKDLEYPETPVYFYLPAGKKLQINQTTILTDKTTSMINNNVVFQVAKDENDAVPITKGQPVYWFLGASSEINCWNSTIEGYIYGPKAKVSSSCAGLLDTTFTINGTTKYKEKPPIIGAVIVNSVDITNDHCGILYLIPMVDSMPGINIPDLPEGDDTPANWSIDTYIRQ